MWVSPLGFLLRGRLREFAGWAQPSDLCPSQGAGSLIGLIGNEARTVSSPPCVLVFAYTSHW
jgi:hypothetical protein